MDFQPFIESHPIAFWSTIAVAVLFVDLAVVSLVGGWHELAGRFRLTGRFEGISEGMQSGRMKWLGTYRNCLRLGANAEGLYLAVPVFFRFMHPPLFVPWREIKIHRQKHWLFGEGVRLALGSEERIPLLISGSTALMLEEGAGISWPGGR